MEKESVYYQFLKDRNYPLFIKFDDSQLEMKFSQMLDKFQFTKLDGDDLKKIQINNKKTHIIYTSFASPKVAAQIKRNASLDIYGSESISEVKGSKLYRYKAQAIMMFDNSKPVWELALLKKEYNEVLLKTLLTRFISFALGDELLGFWGVAVDQGLVVMRPDKSMGESFFISIKDHFVVTLDGLKDLDEVDYLMRLDDYLEQEYRVMGKEQYFAFLSTHSTQMSTTGINKSLKEQIYSLTQLIEGVIYPSKNFQPRKQLEV